MSYPSFGRIIKRGSLLHLATERVAYDDELVSYRFKARGKLRGAASEVGDPDSGDFRAHNTRGWKARKHRYQWEHKVIAAEKRAKKHRR